MMMNQEEPSLLNWEEPSPVSSPGQRGPGIRPHSRPNPAAHDKQEGERPFNKHQQ